MILAMKGCPAEILHNLVAAPGAWRREQCRVEEIIPDRGAWLQKAGAWRQALFIG
ncbi:hypothetical protein A2U01_0090496, partial [Trifolium medium]|nr:hypothetical protein [Trifolium medium]